MDDQDVVTIGGTMEIAKADEPARNVFGWASVIEKDGATVTDHQGDRIELAELEKAAYEYVLDWRESGDMHDKGPVRGRVIESMVFTPEKLDALGIEKGTMPVTGWWLGVHFDDAELFEKVRSGERPAFSIEGQAIRVPVED